MWLVKCVKTKTTFMLNLVISLNEHSIDSFTHDKDKLSSSFGYHINLCLEQTNLMSSNTFFTI